MGGIKRFGASDSRSPHVNPKPEFVDGVKGVLPGYTGYVPQAKQTHGISHYGNLQVPAAHPRARECASAPRRPRRAARRVRAPSWREKIRGLRRERRSLTLPSHACACAAAGWAP